MKFRHKNLGFNKEEALKVKEELESRGCFVLFKEEHGPNAGHNSGFWGYYVTYLTPGDMRRFLKSREGKDVTEPLIVYEVRHVQWFDKMKTRDVVLGIFENKEVIREVTKGYDPREIKVTERQLFDSYKGWVSTLEPGTPEAELHLAEADPEYKEYLRLRKKYEGATT